MKSTGITRSIDPLGRIVIPMEIRRVLDIQPKRDYLEIFVEGDDIILRKYEQSCVFCHSNTDTSKFKGQCVCAKCKKELSAE